MRGRLGPECICARKHRNKKRWQKENKKAVWRLWPRSAQVTFERAQRAHSFARAEQKLFQSVASFMKYSIDKAC